MLLRYFYDPKLAHASYLVGCQATGEAIVIDPGRNIAPYLATAAAEGLHLTAVTETHIHADFVSGARALAERTAAVLYRSDEGDRDGKYQYPGSYPHRLLKDGATWQIGSLHFEAMHTPGHTSEHLAFLVTDTARADQPLGVFSGDCVFVGDVGRPDLLETAVGIVGTKETNARALYASLQRFRTLADYLQIWPAHRAGSACGKALGAIPSSTVGYERHFNWAFQLEDEAAFVAAVLTGQPEPPRYFAIMKRLNREGLPHLDSLPQPPSLPIEKLVALQATGTLLVDTRDHAVFARGFIPGSLNISARNRAFSTYAGWLLDYDLPFYLLIDPAALPEAVADLAAIGLDRIAGFFSPEIVPAWAARTGSALETIRQVTVHEVASDIESGRLPVIDVRSAEEFQNGHVPQARNIHVGLLLDHLDQMPVNRPFLVYCQSGFRSGIAASLLASRGRTGVMNLSGGYQAWAEAKLPAGR